ncbi:MAG: hypothetical protein K1Y01_18450 [Vicinamibacteria bacterium]|nr:hypothetical protein [Vicinamibacteria bacterium]
MGCACVRLPRSADWSCLQGAPPDPAEARAAGFSVRRMRCRYTDLCWEIGLTMDRELAPHATIAAESLNALLDLVDRGAIVAADAELGHAAARCGRPDIVVERLRSVLRREGPTSEHRYAWIRACRTLGLWDESARFLDTALADPRHDAFDLESWILARAQLGRLDASVLEQLRAEPPRYARVLERAHWPLPMHSTGEPDAFSAFAPLLLRFDPRGGLDLLREFSRTYDLSLQLPFAWAFLAQAQRLDASAAIDLVLERCRHLQRYAAAPWEAGWQPLLWYLLPVEHHEAAADVLVMAGARSRAAVLCHAMEAVQRLTTPAAA